MRVVLTDGTEFSCGNFRAIESGVLLTTDKKRKKVVGFVPTHQVRYVVPDDLEPVATPPTTGEAAAASATTCLSGRRRRQRRLRQGASRFGPRGRSTAPRANSVGSAGWARRTPSGCRRPDTRHSPTSPRPTPSPSPRPHRSRRAEDGGGSTPPGGQSTQRRTNQRV